MAMLNRAVFLDRDGTLIADKGYVYQVGDLHFLPGVIDGLLRLQAMGFLLIVVTNQSGIARGYYSEDDYQVFTSAMLERLGDRGVFITAAYHCPHLLGCHCRKPELGMFLQAQKDWDVDLQSSYALGDKLRDLSLCQAYSTTGFLLGGTSGQGGDLLSESEHWIGQAYAVPDFFAAVSAIANLEDSDVDGS